MTEEVLEQPTEVAAEQVQEQPTESRTADLKLAEQPTEEPKAFELPEEYRKKPWAEKIKSEEDLYKQIDNLQGLVGKKNLAPDFENATEAEIEDYYKSLRPADKSEYEFGEEYPEELKEQYSDLLYKNGISKFQASNMIKQMQEIENQQKEIMFSKEGFEKSLQESFGDKWQQAGGEAANLLKANLNKDDQALLEGIPNDMLAVMYRFAANINKQYGAKETGLAGEYAGQAPSIDLKAEQSKLIKEIQGLKNRPFGDNKRAELQARLNDVTNRLVKRGVK